jgi:integrase
MNCARCGASLSAEGRRDRLYCNANCRLAAYRARRRDGTSPPTPWRHPALRTDDPVLRAAAAHAQQLGETHGWNRHTVRWVLDGLIAVLDGRSAGERVPMTDVRARPHERVARSRLAEVLADLDLLDDDATPAIRFWIDRRASQFPSGFAEPVRRWLRVLLDGDVRTKPRSPQTVYRYLGAVRPFLTRWASERDHLREITRADVDAAVAPLHGYRRNNAIAALRSLFRFAKKRGYVFADPTRHLSTPRPEFAPSPMTDAEIRAIEHAASGPADRLIIALAAEYAARSAAIRQLTFENIDLANRRISIAGHDQRLGDLTHRALLAWLDHRRATWPRSPNRHVLISHVTALETRPVTQNYFRKRLWSDGIRLERIRHDRILHEALTTSPDPLHLTLVFNVSHPTACRYADIAQRLLDDELEQPDAGHDDAAN